MNKDLCIRLHKIDANIIMDAGREELETILLQVPIPAFLV